ncbi:MAG: hypothetical protein ABIH40_06330 [Candidatus Omnitrophota bacterium]
MCCEECPKFEKCAEDSRLKDNCCSKCSEYNDCAGMDARERNSFRDSYRDVGTEEYFENN